MKLQANALIAIIYLLGVFLPTTNPISTKSVQTPGTEIWTPVTIAETKQVDPLPPVEIKEVQPIAPIPDPKPVETPKPPVDDGWHYDCRPQRDAVYQAVLDLGLGDQWTYIDYIFSHESCHDPGRLNSGGCAGLGQRCPGSTLRNVCGANDIHCQVRHFNDYAMRAHGGTWASNYAFWLANSWW